MTIRYTRKDYVSISHPCQWEDYYAQFVTEKMLQVIVETIGVDVLIERRMRQTRIHPLIPPAECGNIITALKDEVDIQTMMREAGEWLGDGASSTFWFNTLNRAAKLIIELVPRETS